MQGTSLSGHTPAETHHRYARTIEVSKRVRWEIDRDVIRGRSFDFGDHFLPEDLSLADELDFLSAPQRRRLSQVQGRTYANMFALVERYIGAKMLELSRDHWLGDQTALEAVVRVADEELKHQALFRRIEAMAAVGMPPGYHFEADGNDIASFVLGKSTWAVMALTCHIELFTQAHYRASIAGAQGLSPLFKDVLLHHWREESQHAIVDELEWLRADAKLASGAERDVAVNDLIALIAGVDGILRVQAKADAAYFLSLCEIGTMGRHAAALHDGILKAYRWQYIVSGASEPRFQALLSGLVSSVQMRRIQAALAPLNYAVPAAALAAAAH